MSGSLRPRLFGQPRSACVPVGRDARCARLAMAFQNALGAPAPTTKFPRAQSPVENAFVCVGGDSSNKIGSALSLDFVNMMMRGFPPRKKGILCNAQGEDIDGGVVRFDWDGSQAWHRGGGRAVAADGNPPFNISGSLGLHGYNQFFSLLLSPSLAIAAECSGSSSSSSSSAAVVAPAPAGRCEEERV